MKRETGSKASSSAKRKGNGTSTNIDEMELELGVDNEVGDGSTEKKSTGRNYRHIGLNLERALWDESGGGFGRSLDPV